MSLNPTILKLLCYFRTLIYDLLILFLHVLLLYMFFIEGDQSNKSDEYKPWPGYQFTGKLRPAPRDSIRKVPEAIGRPDYATHPKGIPLSEQAVKGSYQIKVLDDEEIEGMRVACKVLHIFYTTGI